MKRYLSVFAIVAVVGTMLVGCATLFKGGEQKVAFASSPDQAKVYVDGHYMGTTPVDLKLQVKHSYQIQFKKEGYQTRTVDINNRVGAGWIVLDVLGGLIPVVVDAATGNWYHLDQSHVNAMLEKQQ